MGSGRVDELLGLCGEARRLLQEAAHVLDRLAAEAGWLRSQHEGYSFCITWVKGKSGKKKYFYAYLKSSTREPKSIYLGPADKVEEPIKIPIRNVSARLLKAKSEIEKALEAVKVIEEFAPKMLSVRNRQNSIS